MSGMDKDIEAIVQRCFKCQHSIKLPPQQEPSPCPKVAAPWSRIHLDFSRLIRSHSGLKSTTITMLITSLRHTFSTHGLPETILTDNGAQFSSALPQDFCWSYNVIHVYSSPYHPRSNGQEDRFVDTLKWPLQKSCGEGTTEANLDPFL
ncbi:unnamed protein product [Hymenolepis diminuta]|uniref:Integrase catalytic domain-containing protein n=1 Tax=Hymenolepis diminuta TaxID=6216 RepID=A0A0R3SBA2_HYMDI|nr:unnamed protein product [Hymenolepis diminuta]